MSTPGGSSGGPGKTGSLLKAKTLSDARELTRTLPEVLRPNWKRFADGASQKYTDFEISRTEDGGFLFKATKPGNVPGSHAEYYKEVDAYGNTTAAYKLTYDNHGRFVHRKDKM